jgi:hypothetical protein
MHTFGANDELAQRCARVFGQKLANRAWERRCRDGGRATFCPVPKLYAWGARGQNIIVEQSIDCLDKLVPVFQPLWKKRVLLLR